MPDDLPRARRAQPRDDEPPVYRSRPRRGGLPAWLVISGGILAVTVLAGVATILMAVNARQRAADPATKLYSREEFARLVTGKTPDEVIAILGKPESTRQTSDGPSESFRYEYRTYDQITGKTDYSVHLYFRRGVVASVSY